MSTSGWAKLIAGALAVCVAVFLMELEFQHMHVRSGPHHWYAEKFYVPSVSRRSLRPRPVVLEDTRGPYDSRQLCRDSIRNYPAPAAWTCRELLDDDVQSEADGHR